MVQDIRLPVPETSVIVLPTRVPILAARRSPRMIAFDEV